MHTIGISFNTQNHPIHSYFKERGGSTNLNQPLYTYILHILYYYAKPLYYIYAKYYAHKGALCIFRLPYGTHDYASFYLVKVHYYDIQNRFTLF